MKQILMSMILLILVAGLAEAVEIPAPEVSSTPAAAAPALEIAALFGAQPASELASCLGPAGYTCTVVTSCDPVRSCASQTGSGPIKTQTCRCCTSGFPPDCTSYIFSVSCGC